LGVFMNTF